MDTATIALLWDNLRWDKIVAQVNKLISRIAKAVIKQKKHLIKRLQYLLANSFFAKLLAVRKVTSNKGKYTAGVDKKIWSTSAAKYKAANLLNRKGYKSKPLRRVYIEKKGKKGKRPLGIPTMTDRAMQTIFSFALAPVAETLSDKTSFGFRKYRSCRDAGEHIFNCLSKKNSARWILEGDIKGCFDNISHKWLADNIPIDKRILKQFIKSGYIYKRKLFPTKAGSPQGGIISPILSNMTLDGIEHMLKSKYWSSSTGYIDRQYNKSLVNFVRYADDFIVTAKNKETLVEIKKMLQYFLKERGLELSVDKTLITHINSGFDFLGWNVRRYNEKLIIKPAKKSFKNICCKIKATIKKNCTTSQEKLIEILNPIIRGWCNYHSCMVSKRMYQMLDSVIFNSLWNWSKRRHPGKSKYWIKLKYFVASGSRDWIFGNQDKKIILATNTKIKRHILVKLNKNPYISQDQEYFTKRRYCLKL